MDFKTQRKQLVDILRQEGITNEDVLKAIGTVPRELFVPADLQEFAYYNNALPIGESQTISQPYVVARMTQVIIENHKPKKVLEIGTGSGYQAAVLSQCVDEVYSIERIKNLLDKANVSLEKLGYKNIHTLHGDGNKGWQKHAPYDGIIVTAAADVIPPALLEQLANHASIIIPVGSQYAGQELQLITRQDHDFETKYLDLVVFVPLLPGKK